MEKLRSYRQARGLTQSDFAALVDVSPAIISRLENDLSLPSLALATRIERETGGEIPAGSWVPHE